MNMAPRAGFDTEQIHDKARKDLLHLLEGVSLAHAQHSPTGLWRNAARHRAASVPRDTEIETDRQCARPPLHPLP